MSDISAFIHDRALSIALCVVCTFGISFLACLLIFLDASAIEDDEASS